MAHIRIWHVKNAETAEKLKALLEANKGNQNLDIIGDDCIFKLTVVNDDSENSPGSIDRVVSMFDTPPAT